jgi:hypothetical protein
MSNPLVDFRGKVTTETHIVLRVKSRRSGEDMAEIARKVLHDWAMEAMDEYRVLNKELLDEGLEGIIVDRRSK